jgi:tetratricopeptide (TPR) repeat protein
MNADSPLPPMDPEQRRAASSLFERAADVMASGGFAHAVDLLQDCCRLDPANLLYRQTLRRAAKSRFRHNGRGHWLAWLYHWPLRLGLMRAVAANRPLEVMRLAERILAINPWDLPAQRSLARAAEGVGLVDVAIWSLEQARQTHPDHLRLHRELAELYERRGHYTQALALWQRVAQGAPRDREVAQRIADLNRAIGPLSEEEADPSSSTSSTLDPVEREVTQCRAQIADAPTRPEGYLSLARLYRQTGRLSAAQEILTQGLQATGQDFSLCLEQADLAIEPYRRDLAITRAKRGERDEEALQQQEAELLREINARERELFRLQADRQPHRRDLRYELAVRLLRCGQVEEALATFRELDGDWRAARGAGYCYRLWGNTAKAVPCFEQALAQLSGDDAARAELLYTLACCHAEAGDYDRALERGAELAELAPEYEDILTLLPVWQAQIRAAS